MSYEYEVLAMGSLLQYQSYDTLCWWIGYGSKRQARFYHPYGRMKPPPSADEINCKQSTLQVVKCFQIMGGFQPRVILSLLTNGDCSIGDGSELPVKIVRM